VRGHAEIRSLATPSTVGFWENLRIFLEISGLKCLVAGYGKRRRLRRMLRAFQIRDGRWRHAAVPVPGNDPHCHLHRRGDGGRHTIRSFSRRVSDAGGTGDA
jgi:hypothetical protein